MKKLITTTIVLIVVSYSEVLKNNVEGLKSKDIKFINPFLPFDKKNLVKKILELPEFKEYNFNKKELLEAAETKPNKNTKNANKTSVTKEQKQ